MAQVARLFLEAQLSQPVDVSSSLQGQLTYNSLERATNEHSQKTVENLDTTSWLLFGLQIQPALPLVLGCFCGITCTLYFCCWRDIISRTATVQASG
jgi:hypothetical protein